MSLSAPFSARILITCVAMVCLMGGCIVGNRPLFRQGRTMHVLHQEGSALKVRTTNGSVRVDRREGSQVSIQADLQSESEERLNEAQITADRQPDGMLLIEVSWPGGPRSNEGCSFQIGIPDVSGLDVKSQNGGVTITGLAGEAQLATSNGSVEVKDHKGLVNARTSNGHIALRNVAGDVKADTRNGRVEIDGATGTADVSTANGSVSVRLDDSSPGPVAVQTSNGAVTLKLGKSFTGQLDMATSNSGIHFSSPARVRAVSVDEHSARLAVGDGTAVSRIRTSNGSIRVEFTE